MNLEVGGELIGGFLSLDGGDGDLDIESG